MWSGTSFTWFMVKWGLSFHADLQVSIKRALCVMHDWELVKSVCREKEYETNSVVMNHQLYFAL